MRDETDIVHQVGNYDVRKQMFGSGRFRPKTAGFIICKAGSTHAAVVASFSGSDCLQRAIDKANTLAKGD